MASVARPKAVPRAIGRPVPRERLASIRNPSPAPSSWRVSKALVKSVPTHCTNPDCGESDVAEEDGNIICRNCGFVLQESHITQELTFGEAANGAAVVQGVYVGANDENARNTGLGSSRVAGGMDSRQITERNGLHAINSLVAALHLNTSHKDRAMQIYRLAIGINFIQGRVTRHVAAICLYIACRMDEESKVMLIDFSDALQINVFKLGQIYSTLVESLHLKKKNYNLYDINPENLIQRFCQDLEFGEDEHKIANEAIQILKRMRRDWMHVGRRPSGVCGAAVILAARMNNYRRTVREVVYTAKVAEATITARLEEFTQTDSSKLSVAEFRHHGLSLEKDHDPPSFYKEQKSNKRLRLTQAPDAQEDEAASEEDDDAEVPLSIEARQNEPDVELLFDPDRQAMPPPPPPVIHDRRRALPTPSESQLNDENEIEKEIVRVLDDPEMVTNAEQMHTSKDLVQQATPPFTLALVTEDDTIDDFDDDPEVANCLLSPVEVALKERLWIHENGEYLREQQAKRIKQELAEANGTARVIVRRKARRPRMGDTSRYTKIDENGQVTRPKTAGEAAKAMLKERAYSTRINYDKIDSLFARKRSSSTSTAAQSRATSVAPSEAPSEAPAVVDETNENDNENEE